MTLSSLLRSPAEQQIAGLPLPCSVALPDGRRIGAQQPRLSFVIRDMRALLHLTQGAIGRLAEDYVEGRLEIEGNMHDLMATAPALLRSDPTHETHGWLMGPISRTRRAIWERTHHSRAKDAAQIQHHYDISDDFYALWLDPLRVYSCAYFSATDMSLAEAQQAKLDHICRKLMLRAGERFLDVGAGWGALLLWAAEHYGVVATGITLSRNQHTYVNRLIEQKGLQGRVKMLLQDYREVDESRPFDKIASVGMCEHVGRPNLPAYFAKMRRLLTPGGLMMNHSITAGGVDNPEVGAGMGDFIDRYIFPGGQLVHVSLMIDAMARGNLEPVDVECLRPHYARTLWHWADALEVHLDEARRVLGKDAEKITRAYRLYLAGSAMGFERGWTSLFQILASRPADVMETDGRSPARIANARSAYPFNRAYMYARDAELERAEHVISHLDNERVTG
ncbi:class I SAM-dependent methyltransferase [Paraburkholderia aspalathi]|uniref:Cyclopropane-fatty-acyl-phospholipid synthase n=1 Tax=Paraburkholderia aspalathi TaxID=1324617 RepID=A0A1I7EJ80_9BURK|nr:class I SAM-dependent methyltransferase [Paraburkholderia aspalathi]SFU23988.1 cyclopropane-fatty-acyl-phospholipid synthase [Paraburkholderia aspalathi]